MRNIPKHERTKPFSENGAVSVFAKIKVGPVSAHIEDSDSWGQYVSFDDEHEQLGDVVDLP
jgi:hypothetical protein